MICAVPAIQNYVYKSRDLDLTLGGAGRLWDFSRPVMGLRKPTFPLMGRLSEDAAR